MRRTKPEVREINPDVRYNSVVVQEFINRVMRRGKKSLAARLVYDALEMVQEKTGRPAVDVFEQATSVRSWKFVRAAWVVPPIRCRWKFLLVAA